MTDIPPRCPICAGVLKVETSFLTRLHLSVPKVNCNLCQRTFDARDAQTMGTAFYNWAELYRGKILDVLKDLPVLSESDMQRVFNSPYKDDMQLIASSNELVRVCLRQLRGVLIEMARGRHASLDVAHLPNPASKSPEVAALLGVTSAESGTKEYELLVVRSSFSNFVLYVHPGHGTAELRVKRAVHAQPANAAKSPAAVMRTPAAHVADR